ncbi:MAG: hypothetical protein GY859_32405, partial [Desulfobacterales bacterium]|nr:hypothetical protein [Desulfobacterales bacterium]
GSTPEAKITVGSPLLPESGEAPDLFLNRLMVEIAALSNLPPHPDATHFPS